MIAVTPKRIRKDFFTTLQQMEKDRHLYVKEPLKDFTRNGTFSFQRTMLFLTQMESHSTNREINDFFLPLGLPITQSAFVQARGKFNAEAFPALFHRFNGKYKFRKKQFGLHLLAIDGSGARQISRVRLNYLARSPRSSTTAEPAHPCLSFAHCCLLRRLTHRLPLLKFTRLNRFTLSHCGSRAPLSTLKPRLAASAPRLSTGC